MFVQLEWEEELALDTMYCEMLPVLGDFLILSKVQHFLGKELILWDTEGHWGTAMWEWF